MTSDAESESWSPLSSSGFHSPQLEWPSRGSSGPHGLSGKETPGEQHRFNSMSTDCLPRYHGYAQCDYNNDDGAHHVGPVPRTPRRSASVSETFDFLEISPSVKRRPVLSPIRHLLSALQASELCHSPAVSACDEPTMDRPGHPASPVGKPINVFADACGDSEAR